MTEPINQDPANRQALAEQAITALMDADSLLFGLGWSLARSGSINVSSLKPIVDALHESLPALKQVVEEYDAEKAEVADAAYGKGWADALRHEAEAGRY